MALNHLSPDQVASYHRNGYLSPLHAMAPAQAQTNLARYQALCAQEGGVLTKRSNNKPHLLVPWLAELVRHPAILDAVEDVIGPNLLCWASGFFHKPANSSDFVSWHQDSTYWGLSKPEVVTAWVAFTASLPVSGCMRVIAGTQTQDQLAHRDTFSSSNMLSRGQEVAVNVDPSKAIDIVLQPGEFSLHHIRIVHGSEPNCADWPRIGFAIRYIPTDMRQLSAIRDSATLVRGRDDFGHFDPEPAPQSDFHPDAVAFHSSMIERTTQILFAGASKKREYEPLRSPP